ncbi:MAG: hypothetical protein A2787_05705 [Omnitrophica WOR_2 bacterium RIFCSPHIGHO2_01_FULL_48_9]|nr:MAG: hypothetical protein A3D10_08900 [Omnitrophica WOR_2 bacterium RIFCSPHIGHO2_02_FULL_48_11]OGX30644.1 MAG: hypothetical protein A2787_05705 [Omnitrophica WOR_2 bacterium RIFCSPHIGHO2_01_FULL_48_9]
MGAITVFAVALSLSVSASAEEQWTEVASLTPVMLQEEVVTQSVAKWIDEKVAANIVIGRDELYKALSGYAANNAETTFKSYIAATVPPEVKLLDGHSTHWQGFTAYLIFQADQKAFKTIAKGYQNIPLEQVQAEAKAWFPEDITSKSNITCFYKKDDYNNSYYLFWDAQGQRVFFKGLEKT